MISQHMHLIAFCVLVCTSEQLSFILLLHTHLASQLYTVTSRNSLYMYVRSRILLWNVPSCRVKSLKASYFVPPFSAESRQHTSLNSLDQRATHLAVVSFFLAPLISKLNYLHSQFSIGPSWWHQPWILGHMWHDCKSLVHRPQKIFKIQCVESSLSSWKWCSR